MASIGALQEQIFQREGFRVSFERFDASRSNFPDYAYPVMAPNTWRVSDWKTVRLAAYVPFFKNVTVYRGDDEPVKSNVRLGHLRDTYYAATYGDLEPTTKVVPLKPKRKK